MQRISTETFENASHKLFGRHKPLGDFMRNTRIGYMKVTADDKKQVKKAINYAYIHAKKNGKAIDIRYCDNLSFIVSIYPKQ
ncbi:MAG: hypothetical protein L6Q51_14530 [Cyclobacteriaceae bacterium]|nr:hypothetical protein [Cyclobacteriaceae bacterium]